MLYPTTPEEAIMKRFNTKKIGLATILGSAAIAVSLSGAGAASADSTGTTGTEEFNMAAGGKFVPVHRDPFPTNFNVKDHTLFMKDRLFDVKNHPKHTANGHALFTVQRPTQKTPPS
jgi:hypothetical protein